MRLGIRVKDTKTGRIGKVLGEDRKGVHAGCIFVKFDDGTCEYIPKNELEKDIYK